MNKGLRTLALCGLLLLGGRVLGAFVLSKPAAWLGCPIGALAAAVVFVLSYPPRTSRPLHPAVPAAALIALATVAMPGALVLMLMATPRATQPYVLALWGWTLPGLLLVLYAGWGWRAPRLLRGLNIGLAVFFGLYAIALTIMAVYLCSATSGLGWD